MDMTLVGIGMAVGGVVGMGAAVGVLPPLQAKLTASNNAIKANNVRYCDFMTHISLYGFEKIYARIPHKFTM
jgi:hypothetical protein